MPEIAEIYDDEDIIRQALDNFTVLVNEMDYDFFFSILAIGRMQFLLRKRMRIEFGGLFIALWRLALGHSFPNVADSMFSDFLSRYTQAHPGRIGAQVYERAIQYWDMLEKSSDTNFNSVGRHLSSFVIKEEKDIRPLTLKLALGIRQSYRFIFDHLI